VTAIVVGIVEGDGIMAAATLGVGIVAALAAALGSYITWRGNRDNAQEQKQIADDIRRLTELTQGSIEEARAARPAPVVRFIVEKQGAEGASLTRTRIERPLDVEAIVALERRRAMATVPTPPKPKPKQAGELGSAFAGIQNMLAEQAALYKSIGGLGALGGQGGPATLEEKADFEKKVDKHLAQLRKWLRAYERWENQRHELISIRLRFENHGRVPCLGGIYQAHFPDPIERGPNDYPELHDAPARPKFSRPGLFSIPDLMTSYPLGADRLPRLGPVDFVRNVSSVRFRKGSVIVEIEVKKLLHGVYEDSDSFLLRCPTDGAYTIPWQIHAENLPDAASGELQFEVTTKVETGAPITDIEDLLALVWPDDESEKPSPDED
jgi:hypothetical protein